MGDPNFETMAVADFYAKGLLAAAGKDRQEQVARELADLVAYMHTEPGFQTFLTSNLIDDDCRRDSLEKLFRSKMDDLLLNCLQVMNRRRRLWMIDAVARCVRWRMQAKHGAQEITVTSAVPLWHEIRTAIRAVVGGFLGKTVILQERIKPEMIGGITIQVGDMFIDGSVKSRVDAVRKTLFDKAAREVSVWEKYVTDSSH